MKETTTMQEPAFLLSSGFQVIKTNCGQKYHVTLEEHEWQFLSDVAEFQFSPLDGTVRLGEAADQSSNTTSDGLSAECFCSHTLLHHTDAVAVETGSRWAAGVLSSLSPIWRPKSSLCNLNSSWVESAKMSTIRRQSEDECWVASGSQPGDKREKSCSGRVSLVSR